jgi:penicillin-binding protein 2
MDKRESADEGDTQGIIPKQPAIPEQPEIIQSVSATHLSGSLEAPEPPSDETVVMAPEQVKALLGAPAPVVAPRRAPVVAQRLKSNQRSGPSGWAYALTTLLIIGLIGGGAYVLTRGASSSSNVGPKGCGADTPCQVANAYIAAFTGEKYQAMYELTSQASRARFSDPAILHAAAKYPISHADYVDAQDYITLRTQYIVQAAGITNMAATPGAISTINATQVSVPVRMILTSSRVGQIAEDINIPLRKEGSAWKVDWSPGLIFPQLDNSADPNYTDVVRLIAADGLRGAIYDAEGDKIALDGTVYQIQVCPSQIKNQNAVITALTSKIDLTPNEITGAYQGQDPNQCYTVRTISPMLYAQVSSGLNLQGIQTQQATGRIYPYGQTLAAVTGYVGQVNQDDLNNDKANYYEAGDVIGRAGVEAWGEQYLRPVNGGQLVIRARNADGSDGPIQATIAQRQPVNGDDIRTTINLAAQQAAMSQLQSESPNVGGAVAVDPETGAVLVMISNPIYDPNDLALGLTANEQARLNAENHPYLNRAVQEAEPSGSALKPVTLAAGLENGVSADQIFVCPGYFTLPGVSHVFIDDKPTGHGSLTAPQALAPSCDVIFWTIGAMLNSKDPNILPSVVKQFGYGSPTNMVGLPDGVETAGVVPDPDWLKQNENATWTAVDAVNLAIGQGFFLATPAQMAMASAAIANGGTRYQPFLVSSVTDTSGASVRKTQVTKVGTLSLTAANLQVLQVALLGPIHDSDGTTAVDFVNYPINVAGKTGTAESGTPQPDGWFFCYAPASPITGNPVTPTVAIAAMVPHSGTGEHFAVPITKAIMDSLFDLKAGT